MQDMVPYIPMLLPELQKALVDPLPEVRAMAARAMGSLMQVRALGLCSTYPGAARLARCSRRILQHPRPTALVCMGMGTERLARTPGFVASRGTVPWFMTTCSMAAC